MNSALYSIVAVLAMTSVAAQAASFDCKKAQHVTEKTIRADPGLSKLDEALAAAFKTRLAAAVNKGGVLSLQRDFLKVMRSKCTDAACIKADYTTQIAVLGQPLEERFTSNYKTSDATDLVLSGHTDSGFDFSMRLYNLDNEETYCHIPAESESPLRARYASPHLAQWKSEDGTCELRFVIDDKPTMGATWLTVESKGLRHALP